MKWTAYEYYTSLPAEFNAAVEGYYDDIKEHSVVIRFASFRLAECFAGSKAIGSIDNFWPMKKDEVEQQEPMTQERIEAIFKRHNIKVK